jgi:hypothetical protein
MQADYIIIGAGSAGCVLPLSGWQRLARGDKGRGDACADDQQTVVAQDQGVATAEIGQEACSFLGVSTS